MTENTELANETEDRQRILLADDEASIRRILETRLKMAGYDVYTAQDGEEAVNSFNKNNPDLVVLDVMMPKMDGYGVTREIRRTSDVPIIILTALGDVSERITGLELGADDYVIKPFRNMELLSRIKNVLRRNRSGNELTFADLKMDVDIRKLYKADNEVKLTKLEFEILKILLQNPKKVFTREEILSHIWDSAGNFVNDNTLTVTMKRLRDKVEDKEGNIIVTVRGVGYRLSD